MQAWYELVESTDDSEAKATTESNSANVDTRPGVIIDNQGVTAVRKAEKSTPAQDSGSACCIMS